MACLLQKPAVLSPVHIPSQTSGCTCVDHFQLPLHAGCRAFPSKVSLFHFSAVFHALLPLTHLLILLLCGFGPQFIFSGPQSPVSPLISPSHFRALVCLNTPFWCITVGVWRLHRRFCFCFPPGQRLCLLNIALLLLMLSQSVWLGGCAVSLSPMLSQSVWLGGCAVSLLLACNWTSLSQNNCLLFVLM